MNKEISAMIEHDGEPTFYESLENLEQSVQLLINTICAAGVSASDISESMKAFSSPYIFTNDKQRRLFFAEMFMGCDSVITAPDAIPLSDTEYAGFGSGAWSMETGNPLDLKGIV